MTISNISAAMASMEKIPTETSMPVSAPHKTAAAEKIQAQLLFEQQKAAVTKTKETQKESFSVENAREMAAEMNEIMNDLQTSLGFSIREDLNHQVVVEIKDRQTDELIKQIPSEEMLNIKQKMEELTGLILDQSA